MIGGQIEWQFATPWLYRALASPWTGEPVLAVPRERESTAHRTAYWASVLSLLCFRLGWPCPERGLLRWFEQEHPRGDPTLDFIAHVLREDGTLPLLMEWLGEKAEWLMPQFESVGYRGPQSPGRPRSRKHNGYGPWLGPWQMHLEGGTHLAGPLDHRGSAGTTSLLTAPQDQRASLVCEKMTGWYRALYERTRHELPRLGDGWEVDVWIAPFGHLGTFRRSPVTGLWSTAREAVHLFGAL